MKTKPSKEKQKEYSKTAYSKLRNDPIKWKKVLKRQRDRYKKFGHKKYKSICIACGKEWLGVAKLRKFCSQKCVSHWSFNGRWKGGKYINKQGYALIRTKSQSNNTYVLEHVLMIEKKLGRKLKEDEVVHHKNHNKQDNRIENLEVMSNSKHSKKHWEYWNKNGGSPVEIRTKNRLKRKSSS
jgi:endogenous inhibitor of DNA gyrase (YacG/DUF329 family)